MSVNARAMKRLGIAGKRRKDRRRITGSQGTLPPTHPGEGKIRRKPCLLVAEERNDAKGRRRTRRAPYLLGRTRIPLKTVLVEIGKRDARQTAQHGPEDQVGQRDGDYELVRQ